jgi:hypothetical protein
VVSCWFSLESGAKDVLMGYLVPWEIWRNSLFRAMFLSAGTTSQHFKHFSLKENFLPFTSLCQDARLLALLTHKLSLSEQGLNLFTSKCSSPPGSLAVLLQMFRREQ